jgi:hypothetical protein
MHGGGYVREEVEPTCATSSSGSHLYCVSEPNLWVSSAWWANQSLEWKAGYSKVNHCSTISEEFFAPCSVHYFVIRGERRRVARLACRSIAPRRGVGTQLLDVASGQYR